MGRRGQEVLLEVWAGIWDGVQILAWLYIIWSFATKGH
jgi:hypothetical protein